MADEGMNCRDNRKRLGLILRLFLIPHLIGGGNSGDEALRRYKLDSELRSHLAGARATIWGLCGG